MNVSESVSHEQAVELLPWLVNGTLDAQERQVVFEHAHACVICRRELSNLHQLQESFSDASNTVLIPEPDMRKINARIDALVDRQNWVRTQLSRLREIFDSPWRIGFVAQTVVLIVLTTVLFWPEREGVEFRVLMQDVTIPDGSYVRVVFTPDLQQAQITNLLDKFDLTIVEGPSERGIYTLGFSDAAEANDGLVQSLQDDPNILFAQPVIIGVDQ